MGMTEANRFDDIVKETYTKLIELHPEQSMNIGLSYLDKPLPDLSKNTIPIERGLIQIQLEKLKDINVNELPMDKRLDYMAFKDYLKLRLFFIDDWPIWKMYPEAPDIAFNMIINVYLKRDISNKEKLRYVLGKLEELPSFLEKSKSRLETPVQLFIDAGILSSQNLMLLVKGIYNDFITKEDISSEVGTKKKIFDTALNAIESYIEWLQKLREKEIRDFTMGKQLYQKLLNLRRVEDDIGELEKEIIKDMNQYHAQLKRVAGELDKEKNIRNVLKEIMNEYPRTAAVALSLYNHGLLEVKKIIKEKKILDLPDIEVEIVPVPTMIKETLPEIYYFPSFKQAGEIKIVEVYVNLSDEPELLKLHNAYFALHRILQTIYPGYHVIFTRTVLNNNKVRIMLDIPEVYEGWSIYSDFLMAEYNFLTSKKDTFIRQLSLYRNALLAYLDIMVNTGEMKHVEALKKLMEDGYMTRSEAVASILKMVISPSLSLSSYIGFKSIWGLRNAMKEFLKRKYSDRWFNNEFLRNSALPINFMKIILLDKAMKILLTKEAERTLD